MSPAGPGPSRHAHPELDELALAAARAGDRLVAAARTRGAERWVEHLAPIPELLRDAPVAELRGIALRARAAYGAKDSVRDDLPAEATEPFLDAVDRLLRGLAALAARG